MCWMLTYRVIDCIWTRLLTNVENPFEGIDYLHPDLASNYVSTFPFLVSLATRAASPVGSCGRSTCFPPLASLEDARTGSWPAKLFNVNAQLQCSGAMAGRSVTAKIMPVKLAPHNVTLRRQNTERRERRTTKEQEVLRRLGREFRRLNLAARFRALRHNLKPKKSNSPLWLILRKWVMRLLKSNPKSFKRTNFFQGCTIYIGPIFRIMTSYR